MKKLSKVLSVVLAVAMLCSMSFAVNAATYTDVKSSDSYYEAVEALSALGVVKGYEAGDFQPEGKITRAEAATMILRVMNMGAAESNRVDTIFSDVKSDHWASGTIAEANGAGIINGMGDGTFAPEAEVTYDQIVKMLVCAMGYQKQAESKVATGTNPFPTGYNIVANQKKITEGTTKTEGGATRATVARLIYNALPVNLMDQTSYGTDENFSEVATQSLLYTKLDAIKVEAKISKIELDPTEDDVEVSISKYDDVAKANGYTTGYTTTAGLTVNPSISTVKKGDVDLTGLQGLTVTALIDISDSDEPVLLAVFSKAGKNDELVIAPELYEGAVSGKIKYKKDLDTSTESTAKIADNVAVYLNLVSLGNKNYNYLDSLKITNIAATNVNEFKFVDTDNNGDYDTLFIDEAASFVVGRIDAEEQGIYKNNSSSVLTSKTPSIGTAVGGTNYDYDFSPLNLDTEDDDVAFAIKDSDGKELAFEDIEVGDILTVRQSTDGANKYFDITVATSSSVEGTITEVSDETVRSQTITYYTIDGTAYRVNGNAADSSLEAGTTGTFRITADGKIISYNLEASARTFGVVIAMANSTSSFSNVAQIQVATADGSIKTYDVADKISVNGKPDASNVKVTQSATNGAYDTIDSVKIDAGTIVMYETNKDDEIRRIYTTSSAIKSKTNDDYEVITLDGSKEYNAAANRVNGKYFDENTAIISVGDPADVAKDDNYTSSSLEALTDGEFYEGSLVIDSSKQITFAFITNLAVKPANDSEALVITGTSTTSVDGEKRDVIKGYVGNKEVSYTVASEDVVDMYEVDGTKFGTYAKPEVNEAIQFVLNANDEIISIKKLVSKSHTSGKLVVAVVSDFDDDEDADARNAKLYDLITGKEVASNTEFSGFKGYAGIGKVNEIKNTTIEFLKDWTVDTGKTDAENLAVIEADTNLFSTSFNNTAYFYGAGYNKVKTGSLDSVKYLQMFEDDIKLSRLNSTDKNVSTCEDIVYVYNYDGVNVLNYVYDTLGNSK